MVQDSATRNHPRQRINETEGSAHRRVFPLALTNPEMGAISSELYFITLFKIIIDGLQYFLIKFSVFLRES